MAKKSKKAEKSSKKSKTDKKAVEKEISQISGAVLVVTFNGKKVVAETMSKKEAESAPADAVLLESDGEGILILRGKVWPGGDGFIQIGEPVASEDEEEDEEEDEKPSKKSKSKKSKDEDEDEDDDDEDWDEDDE